MSRRLTALAGLLITLGLFTSGLFTSVRSQDSPSLGDLARQLRKDKPNPSTAKVFTNDDIAPSRDSGSPELSVQVLSKPGSSEAAHSEIDKMEAKMNALDSVDRATLVKIALQGQDTAFPGRPTWEDKLWDAKRTYVRQGREVVERSKEILSIAKSLRDSQGGEKLKPDDPKLKDLLVKSRQLVQDAKRAEAEFLAVVAEGADLAKQSALIRTSPSHP
jgi:hypothetical protein